MDSSLLSMRQAPPQRMLSLVRGHWVIENKLHYRRDVSLGEDVCQTRDFTRAWPPGSAQ
jgi:predicted transposase YbfD/YdcC